MRKALAIVLVGLAAWASAAATDEPGAMVSVRACGAIGDGETDDTQAFLAAVEQAKAGETHVFVPKGTYRVSAPVVLENVAVNGPAGGAWPADIDALPSILATHRDGPAFHLLAGGALHGIDIDYKWEEAPSDGPPAVLISGIGVYVSNVRIRYAWDGILTDGKSNVGRLNIENVFMVAIRNVGVRVTGTWDVPRLNNIEVWNAGPGPRGLEKGVGFHLGKNDLIRMTDCFAFAMGTGFLFEDEIDGLEITGGTWGVMNGCSTDYCGKGIVALGAHTLSISGGTFWNHVDGLTVDGGGGRIRVSGCEIKSNGGPAVVVGDCDHVALTGCSLLRSMKEYDPPAVLLKGGDTVLNGNLIDAQGPGVVIQKDVSHAVITGNLIRSGTHPDVVNESGSESEVVIESNSVSTGDHAPKSEGDK